MNDQEQIVAIQLIANLNGIKMMGVFDPQDTLVRLIPGTNRIKYCDLTFRDEPRELDPRANSVHFSIALINDVLINDVLINDVPITYKLVISEQTNHGQFVAYGNLTRSNNNVIFVNDVEEGRLTDPYNDGFDICYNTYGNVLQLLGII